MRIGIDARLINETGVGRYIRNLIAELGTIDKENAYVVFLRKDSFESFESPNSRWHKRLADVPWHSVAEQFVMPWLLVKERLDLVHIPYFNVPIFYPGKFIVTIHDLTILHFDTGKATTLPLQLYKLRRLGYYLALTVGLKRATKVIAVSNTTKQEIIDHFGISPEKITVTYEGVDEKVKSQKSHLLRHLADSGGQSKVKSQKPLIESPYFLYVGNAYPHKNLETLLRAFQQYTVHSTQYIVKLVLVGKDDFFYRRIKELVGNMKLDDSVIFFGQADDMQLDNLYAHAIALVFPSFMEGFGLPGLEAMACECPVVCSDIPIFHEIYGDATVYFNPKSPEDMISKFKAVMSDKTLQNHLIEKGKLQVKQYSWSKLGQQTLAVYQKATE